VTKLAGIQKIVRPRWWVIPDMLGIISVYKKYFDFIAKSYAVLIIK